MAEEPAYLTVGTDVSAKYRGAFCEAKVKKVVRNVKCKVTLKETGSSLVVTHEDINGHLKTGLTIEVKHPESGQHVPAVINKITDQSSYTVVFDDGDENTLRRTQLCLKGEKHFVKSDTLDELPLTHPEHFGTPVMRGSRSLKSKRYMHNASSDSDSDVDSSEEDVPRGRTTRGNRREREKWIGQVVCVEIEDRKKTMWVPALVVRPSADNTALKSLEHILVKSFRDCKFFQVLQRDVKEFTREMATKNEDKILKIAFERALQYFDTHELPQMWDKDELLGSDSEDDDDTSDDEPSEERDRFVAQLYKFMDDRGTPMNKSPQISGRDLNLYKMFRVVQDMGGYNKVTNQVKWHVVYSKLALPPATSAANQIKMAYKKFLHAFEDFDRKLGCTMGTITRPRVRHYSGRNLMSFRERESTPKSPRSARSNKDDDDKDESGKDLSDRSDVDSAKGFKHHLLGNSSDSETDSVNSRTVTRERPTTREDLSRLKEESSRPMREEVRRGRDEAAAQRLQRDEDRKSRAEKDAPVTDDKEEGRQPKKRGRKKDAEDIKEEKRLFSKRPAKDDTASEVSEDRTENSDDDGEESDRQLRGAYSIGSKIRIKYGNGKNNKIYEAKVIEEKFENGVNKYKVHYAGWNVRYDEWIRKDRIVGLVGEPAGKNKCKVPPGKMPPSLSTKPNASTPTAKKLGRKQPPNTLSTPTQKDRDTSAAPAKTPASKTSVLQTSAKSPGTLQAKPSPPPKAAASTTGSKPSASAATSKSSAPSPRSKSPVPPSGSGSSKTPAQTTAKTPRPTRSTSIESMLTAGLPSKVRPKKGSVMGDSETQSRDSDSDVSDESSDEEMPERVTRSRSEADSRSVKSMADTSTEPKVAQTLVSTAKSSESEKQTSSSSSEASSESDTVKEDTKKQKQSVNNKTLEPKQETPEVKSETHDVPPSMAAPKSEPKVEKKVDDKIYDFEDSSSQDSFRDDLPLARQMHAAPDLKDVVDKSRFKRKDPMMMRVRRISTDSTASADSALRSSAVKTEGKPADIEQSRTTKDSLRSGKKGTDAKLEPVEADKEKKKPGSKTKDTAKELATDKSKVKSTPKSEKGRGKRKIDTAEGATKNEEVETKKVRRKKDQKEEKETGGKEVPAKKTPNKKPAENQTPMEISKPEETPEKKSDDQSETSWSPTYIPAPTLTQTVSIDTKPELEVIDQAAPQLSPIIGANLLPTTAAMPSVSSEPPRPNPTLQQSLPPTTEPINESVTEPSMIFDNTPPDTPEGSISAPQSAPGTPTRPPQSDSSEAHSEGEACPTERPPPETPVTTSIGGESPNTCDTSTVSNGSGGSSGNAPGSESEDLAAVLKTPKENEVEKEEEKSVPKRRRRRQQGSKSSEKAGKKLFKQSMSDSDEQDHHMKSPELTSRLKSLNCSQSSPVQRVSKYNFLDLEEGKYMEGEARIKFLMGKIQDVRKLYMQLKSEVACIDRRRKRHRRKIHNAQAAAAAAAAVAAVVSRGEAEKS